MFIALDIDKSLEALKERDNFRSFGATTIEMDQAEL